MPLSQLLDNTIQLGMGPEPSKEKAEHASRVMDSQEDEEEVEEVSGVFLGSGMGDVFGLEKEEELAALNAPPPQVESVINVVSRDFVDLNMMWAEVECQCHPSSPIPSNPFSLPLIVLLRCSFSPLCCATTDPLTTPSCSWPKGA